LQNVETVFYFILTPGQIIMVWKGKTGR